MRLVEQIHAAFRERAAEVEVSRLSIGLGYTAVVTDEGGIGLAYTWRDDRACCSHLRGWDDAEGAPATQLLDLLLGGDGLERSIGMAAVNALNHAAALELPRDRGPAGALIERLRIGAGSRIAMVGYFPPVAQALREVGAELEVVDDERGMGDQLSFRERLAGWADALVMTSTTLLGDTADELLRAARPEVRVALLGPTTPLAPEAFAETRVELLLGMVPLHAEAVLRAVRHGAGTPELQRYSRKVYCALQAGAGGRP